MKTTAVPLDHLAQRIAEHQSELESLRREYEARQARLADLAGRKKELEAQLRQVQAEIQAVDRGEAPASPPEPAKATAAVPPAKAARAQTLAEFLIERVRGAEGPLTAKELAGEVVRRKFPTASMDIPQLVKSRVSKLTAQGVFRRAEGQPGVVLAEGKGKPKSTAARPKRKAGKRRRKKGAVPPPKAARAGADDGKGPSLRAVLTDLLAKSQEPVPVRDLAERAKAQGYRSRSKSLADNVWTMLGQMDNVENVPGKGYRLKNR